VVPTLNSQRVREHEGTWRIGFRRESTAVTESVMVICGSVSVARARMYAGVRAPRNRHIDHSLQWLRPAGTTQGKATNEQDAGYVEVVHLNSRCCLERPRYSSDGSVRFRGFHLKLSAARPRRWLRSAYDGLKVRG
jgi:hypothetical protein